MTYEVVSKYILSSDPSIKLPNYNQMIKFRPFWDLIDILGTCIKSLTHTFAERYGGSRGRAPRGRVNALSNALCTFSSYLSFFLSFSIYNSQQKFLNARTYVLSNQNSDSFSLLYENPIKYIKVYYPCHFLLESEWLYTGNWIVTIK